MAEPLKNQFGAEVPRKIATMILEEFPSFAAEAFIAETLEGYETLDLMPRGRKIARTLRRYLPEDYTHAVEILIASLGPRLETTEGAGMAPFLYLPHGFFVAEYGLDHFEASMAAQYELTQRFTAEFSIRPFLERYPEAALARLRTWATDPSAHVRRLVSEGTRPRLPWAPRLRVFQADPRPTLALLELLKDDPEIYVRRSVANHLNDIGKDHPGLLAEIARNWMQDAAKERRWLIRHALRSAVKRGETDALDILGFGNEANVTVRNGSVTPQRVSMGGSVSIAFELCNEDAQPQHVMVDFCIHFVKANGKSSPKVFKLKAVELAPHETMPLKKTLSLADLTTRKHYPGMHTIQLLLNGRTEPLAIFELMEA